MELPKRKRIRLEGYDYSSSGAYFITICAHNHACIFGDVGADSISARMLRTTFTKTMNRYPSAKCPIYVIMPNHFHAIIDIDRADIESAPTISEIVQSFKRYSTIEYIRMVKQGLLPPFDKRIWQRSFHDHIIRNEQEYWKIWQYIDENPLTWKSDCFYEERTAPWDAP